MGTYYNNNGILVPIAGRGSGVNRNDVAYVETGTTASRNYAVGQLVYVSGAMYRVKRAIQSGQTFTVGTNIEATTIGGEIQRINNDLSVKSSTFNVQTDGLGNGIISTALDKIIIAVIADQYVVIPLVSNNKWWGAYRNPNTALTPVTSSIISTTIYYYDIT